MNLSPDEVHQSFILFILTQRRVRALASVPLVLVLRQASPSREVLGIIWLIQSVKLQLIRCSHLEQPWLQVSAGSGWESSDPNERLNQSIFMKVLLRGALLPLMAAGHHQHHEAPVTVAARSVHVSGCVHVGLTREPTFQ